MTRCVAIAVLCIGLLAVSRDAWGHNIYMANENHTDYGWNDTVANYEASMLSELDYYRSRIDATANAPAAEQTRFVADCWYYLYLYSTNRTPSEFQDLINKMLSGHITVPLNPFVTLYGALPTEAAIRGGYWPGLIHRQYGVNFLHAEEMENTTIPWGIASIWAGSGTKYSWKGVCNCGFPPDAPVTERTSGDIFKWHGEDDAEILFKWYEWSGNNQSWGGYSEMRNGGNSSGTGVTEQHIQDLLTRDTTGGKNWPLSAANGYGWDDVNSQISTFESQAHTWNQAHPANPARVSNVIDFFQDLEAYKDTLPVVKGGWGNAWDAWPYQYSARSANLRNAVEKLRAAEALAAIAWANNRQDLWASYQPQMEAAWVHFFQYFEHNWADGAGQSEAVISANKIAWSDAFINTVNSFYTAAATAAAGLFTTPAETRFAVFNPLAFERTDYVDVPGTWGGSYIVTDVATNTEVPNQLVTVDGTAYLRVLANSVPSLGYRVYRYVTGTPQSFSNAATVTGNVIENGLYKVTLGVRGEITSCLDKTNGNFEMVAAGDALNDFGTGSSASLTPENIGPVSVTLIRTVTDTPARSVRITVFDSSIDRIDIHDDITANYSTQKTYRFGTSLTGGAMRSEEVGAFPRVGLSTTQFGDYLPGSRSDYLTVNHFISFTDGGYSITVANNDAGLFRANNSSISAFDVPTGTAYVYAHVNFGPAPYFQTNANDKAFRNSFALQGHAGVYTNSNALKVALQHENPLRAFTLAPSQTGPLTAATKSFLSLNATNTFVTAFKPVEEGNRGLLVRVWETDGQPTSLTTDISAFTPQSVVATSLIETDVGATSLNPDGTFPVAVGAHEMKTYRFLPGAPEACTVDAQCVDNDLCTTDACDAQAASCSHVFEGVTIAARPSVRLLRLTTPQGIAFQIGGGFKLTYPFSPAFDPVLNGIGLRLTAGDGHVVCDWSIPGGALDSTKGVGWVADPHALRWRYRDSGGTVTAVRSAWVKVLPDRTGGPTAAVSLNVLGRNGSCSVTPADQPLSLQLLVGSVPSQCGEVHFSPAGWQRPSCRFNTRATALQCG